MAGHRCHWPGCPVEVAPKYWGCYRHWQMIPDKFRRWIMSAYRPGQEIDKRPSVEYVKAAGAVRQWIKSHPDPTMPPFAAGECVQFRTRSVFDSDDRHVTGCELRTVQKNGKDIGVWFVTLDNGSEWPATDLVKV